MSNGSGGGNGKGAYRPFPSLQGWASGVKGYFTDRLPPKSPSYRPQQEVRDAVTVGNERGYSTMHEQAKGYASMTPTQRERVRDMHDDAFGYGVGLLSSMVLTTFALRRAATMFPAHAAKVRAMQRLNTALGFSNAVSLPNTLNERARKFAPDIHEVMGDRLRIEAKKA